MVLRVPIIYGATCSGKSHLSIELAERLGGCVVNSDSMQLYSNVRLLTARPCEAESIISHYLYGIFDARHRCSAGEWVRLCVDVMRDLVGRGCLPIICGGSGLYIRGLLEGLSPIVDISVGVRDLYEERLRVEGLGVLYEELLGCDLVWAERVGCSDSQRILRGLMVYAETGKALSLWHTEVSGYDLSSEFEFVRILLLPERDELWRRCELRLRGMVSAGVLQEVCGLLQEGLSSSLPLMRAIGVGEFGRYLSGEIDFGESFDLVNVSTRRYIKRQTTWARGQYASDLHIEDVGESSIGRILDLVGR